MSNLQNYPYSNGYMPSNGYTPAQSYYPQLPNQVQYTPPQAYTPAVDFYNQQMKHIENAYRPQQANYPQVNQPVNNGAQANQQAAKDMYVCKNVNGVTEAHQSVTDPMATYILTDLSNGYIYLGKVGMDGNPAPLQLYKFEGSVTPPKPITNDDIARILQNQQELIRSLSDEVNKLKGGAANEQLPVQTTAEPAEQQSAANIKPYKAGRNASAVSSAADTEQPRSGKGYGNDAGEIAG